MGNLECIPLNYEAQSPTKGFIVNILTRFYLSNYLVTWLTKWVKLVQLDISRRPFKLRCGGQASLPLKLEMLSGWRSSSIDNCWSLSTPRDLIRWCRLVPMCWRMMSPTMVCAKHSDSAPQCALSGHGRLYFVLVVYYFDCHSRYISFARPIP